MISYVKTIHAECTSHDINMLLQMIAYPSSLFINPFGQFVNKKLDEYLNHSTLLFVIKCSRYKAMNHSETKIEKSNDHL